MPHSALRLKLYVLGEVLPLSASLPVFENLGLKVIAEDSYPVSLQRATTAGRQEAADPGFPHGARRRRGRRAGRHPRRRWKTRSMPCCGGEAESDGFNRLVIGAGLAWRDVTILRAAAKFLRQAGFPFSQDYMRAGAGAQSGHRARCWSRCSMPATIPDVGDRDSARRASIDAAHRSGAERCAQPG